MPRYFTYRFSGQLQMTGKSGRLYWFQGGTVTEVPIEEDAQQFLLMGSPETGYYSFRETDVNGNPIGPFPPINPANRVSMIDPRRYPTAISAPTADEWREATETLADPILYYHFIRRRIR